MKLAFIGLKGHVGTVLAGTKLLGDVEVVAVAEEDAALMASMVNGPSVNALPTTMGRTLTSSTMLSEARLALSIAAVKAVA